MSSWPPGKTTSSRAEALAGVIVESCRDDESGSGLDALAPRVAALRGCDEGRAVLAAGCLELRRARVFDLLPTRAQELLEEDPFFQTQSVTDAIETQTTVRLEGCEPRRTSAALVDMEWSRWWRHGCVTKWRRRGEEVSFFLCPLVPLPLRVFIAIDAAREDREAAGGLERRKLVWPARFEGGFEGPARFDLVLLPDGCVLRAAWEGVEPRGWLRLLPRSRSASSHLAAERGMVRWAAGSGYLGLRRFLGCD